MNSLTKDTMYDLIKSPDREKFRKYVQNLTGEHNEVDFKEKWIEGHKLAKEMLSISNSGGGVIIVGLHENDDGTFAFPGLDKLEDKANISNKIEKYIDPHMTYSIYDFSFDAAEYEALQGRKYQMMVIDNDPLHVPFFASREGDNLKTNVVYVRRGTKCVEASSKDIEDIINRRINYTYPQTGKPLTLNEHFEQLKHLYSLIPRTIRVRVDDGESYAGQTFIESFLSSISASVEKFTGKYETVPNHNYPEEEFDEYVARMINEKKKKIERVLDLH